MLGGIAATVDRGIQGKGLVLCALEWYADARDHFLLPVTCSPGNKRHVARAYWAPSMASRCARVGYCGLEVDLPGD